MAEASEEEEKSRRRAWESMQGPDRGAKTGNRHIGRGVKVEWMHVWCVWDGERCLLIARRDTADLVRGAR